MLAFLGGIPTWRLHTGLCKFVQHISTNIWILGRRTDLKLGEKSYSFISYNMIISLLIHWMVFKLFFNCVTVQPKNRTGKSTLKKRVSQKTNENQAKRGTHGLLNLANFGTALTWTLVFALWKEFTPTWNQSKCRIPKTIQWKKLRKCDEKVRLF